MWQARSNTLILILYHTTSVMASPQDKNNLFIYCEKALIALNLGSYKTVQDKDEKYK
jgi:hypothetical protein